MAAPRSFSVGETVHFRSRVSLPGTKTPTDPDSVALTSLKLAGVEMLSAPAPFVREAEGEYVLALPTDDLDPGTYDVVVVHSGGPSKVAMSVDRFVLSAV